jgi:hypothetical protein
LGAEEFDMGGEAVPLDQVDEGTGNGAEPDVLPAVGASDYEEDIDAVAGKFGAERFRVGHGVEATLELAGLGQPANFGVVEGLPGPGEDLWIVAGYLEVEAGVIVGSGGVEDASCQAAFEERSEGLLTPGAEGLEDAVGVVGFRRKGIVEEGLKVPLELTEEVAVGAAFYWVAYGRCWRDRQGRLSVAQAYNREGGRIAAGQVGYAYLRLWLGSTLKHTDETSGDGSGSRRCSLVPLRIVLFTATFLTITPTGNKLGVSSCSHFSDLTRTSFRTEGWITVVGRLTDSATGGDSIGDM